MGQSCPSEAPGDTVEWESRKVVGWTWGPCSCRQPLRSPWQGVGEGFWAAGKGLCQTGWTCNPEKAKL